MASEHILLCGLPVRFRCAWRGISVWIPFSTHRCFHRPLCARQLAFVRTCLRSASSGPKQPTNSLHSVFVQDGYSSKQKLVPEHVHGNNGHAVHSGRTNLFDSCFTFSRSNLSSHVNKIQLACTNVSGVYQHRYFHSGFNLPQQAAAVAGGQAQHRAETNMNSYSQQHTSQNSSQTQDGNTDSAHSDRHSRCSVDHGGVDTSSRMSDSTLSRGHDTAYTRYSWIAQHTPAFSVSGDDVQVLHEPHEFYQTLKSEAQSAKKRIVWSSLYLGTGKLEQELVNSVHESLKSNPELSVHVLLDNTRGTRGSKNSCTLLQPIITEFTNRACLSLYHTPDLRGVMRRLVPERYNEVVGLQHMKLYIYDDTVIISGANLSDSYFTNRQDRYVVLRNCPALADFLVRLVEAVSSFSFQLQADGKIKLNPDMPIHPYNNSSDRDGSLFKAEAQRRVEAVISTQGEQSVSRGKPSSADTWVFPLTQMGPFGITVDTQVTTKLFCDMSVESRIFLASGYFNLTDHYRDVIISRSPASFDILTASPEANGFFGGSGISGSVPAAYTYISRCFLQQVSKYSRGSSIRLHEYAKSGWTFHSKGLWAYLPGHIMPTLTLVGSPNFGHRSTHRDLEVQLALVTDNANLQQQLLEEQNHMFKNSDEISLATLNEPDRQSPLWVRIVTTIIRNYF